MRSSATTSFVLRFSTMRRAILCRANIITSRNAVGRCFPWNADFGRTIDTLAGIVEHAIFGEDLVDSRASARRREHPFAGIVEHAIFGEDLVDSRASARGVVFTEDIVLAGFPVRPAFFAGLAFLAGVRLAFGCGSLGCRRVLF